MPKIEWTLVKSKVNDLKEYHINPRQMTKKGLADLKKSITKFGVAEPLVVNQDMTICGGHGRKIVLQEMGIKEVDCYIPNRLLNEKEFQELNIRLNKNIAGEWDFDILANNFDMTEIKDWGFTDFDLKIDVIEDKNKEINIDNLNIEECKIIFKFDALMYESILQKINILKKEKNIETNELLLLYLLENNV